MGDTFESLAERLCFLTNLPYGWVLDFLMRSPINRSALFVEKVEQEQAEASMKRAQGY